MHSVIQTLISSVQHPVSQSVSQSVSQLVSQSVSWLFTHSFIQTLIPSVHLPVNHSAHDLTPDKLYERRWAMMILDQAMARLRKRFWREKRWALRFSGTVGFVVVT